MQLLCYLRAAVAARLRHLAREADRGDSPIPSTVIIVGMAVLAIGLLVWLGTYVQDLINQAPDDIPDQNFN